jgi:hypothetical protein
MGIPRRAVLWLASLWLLVACAGTLVYGDETVLDGTVTLACSETCLSRGSCRPTGPLGQKTVYLGSEPAFPGASEISFGGLRAGTEATVLEIKMVDGVEQGTGQPLAIRFYRVDEIESGTRGWVPGFCLARTP